MFLQDGGNGTKILYIPSVFISYNGEALDEKTVHLRSVEAINKAATKLLHVLGHKDVRKVSTTLGTEQEFFLIDRALYALRPDLKICGRTLCGSLPAKHQQVSHGGEYLSTSVIPYLNFPFSTKSWRTTTLVAFRRA